MTKLHLLAASAAFALLPVLAQAQTTTANLNATGAVQSSVAFSNLSGLGFGTITPGSAATVTTAAGGKAQVAYNIGTLVTATGGTLTGPGGATVAVTLACGQALTGVDPAPTAFTCGTGYTTVLVGNAQTIHWIYVGGTIAGAATSVAPAGNYSGTITLTGTYATF